MISLLTIFFYLLEAFLLPSKSYCWEISRFEAYPLLQKRLLSTLDVSGDDIGFDTALDSSGNIYEIGITLGTFSGETALGDFDCFLTKFNSSRVIQWSQQFGTSSFDACTGITIDTNATPNLYVGGYTSGTFTGQTSNGAIDGFVLKLLSTTGAQTWVRQFGTSGNDYVYDIAVSSAFHPTVSGSTSGSLPGFTNAGQLDAFLYTLNTTAGADRWIAQFGSAKNDEAMGVGVDGSNRFFVGGYTNGTLPGKTSLGSSDFFLARYGNTGTQSWLNQFGTSGTDIVIGVSAVSSGISHIVGCTSGAFAGFSNLGESDFFLGRYTLAGVKSWISQGGTSTDDCLIGSATDSSGNSIAAGRTDGALSGFTNSGGYDGFIVKYTTTGTLSWSRQTGTSGDDTFFGLDLDASNLLYVSGSTTGVFSGQTNLGAEDACMVKYTSAGVFSSVNQFGTN